VVAGYGQITKENLGFTCDDGDAHYLYCGHRNLLALIAWQSPSNAHFRRVFYRVWPRLTLDALGSLTIRLVRLNGSFDEQTYTGPLVNVEASPALAELGTITSSTAGKKIQDCNAMPAGEEEVQGTDFALIVTGDGRYEYTVHGITIEQVPDLGYNAGAHTDEADCVEQCSRTAENLPYEFVDSWLGQAACAHTLDRYAFESQCAIYVPFYGWEYVP